MKSMVSVVMASTEQATASYPRRPAIALDAVNDIAIHYVANPGSSAKANRDYFDSLDNPAVEGAGRQASAHLIVGLDGEVVQCLPLKIGRAHV